MDPKNRWTLLIFIKAFLYPWIHEEVKTVYGNASVDYQIKRPTQVNTTTCIYETTF